MLSLTFNITIKETLQPSEASLTVKIRENCLRWNQYVQRKHMIMAKFGESINVSGWRNREKYKKNLLNTIERKHFVFYLVKNITLHIAQWGKYPCSWLKWLRPHSLLLLQK